LGNPDSEDSETEEAHDQKINAAVLHALNFPARTDRQYEIASKLSNGFLHPSMDKERLTSLLVGKQDHGATSWSGFVEKEIQQEFIGSMERPALGSQH
jgi:hypothetical protein